MRFAETATLVVLAARAGVALHGEYKDVCVVKRCNKTPFDIFPGQKEFCYNA